MFALGCLPPAVSALEMSSKRDCAICHIMWLNDFRTEKKTLIPWQPGNVLMKDTQGVVSSEEICYSCHDGYVNDSRAIAWKYNRHKVFVKPSDNVSIPSSLPLSNKDEIYCGTCHSPHGIGSAPDERTGITSFFREDKTDSILCQMCHVREANYKKNNGHPLNAGEINLPKILFESGGKQAKQKDKVICQSCHKAHGAKGDNIVIVDNSKSELCMMCHEKQKYIIDTKHDLSISLPQEKNIKGKKPSEAGPCGACHTPHNGASKRLWARRLGAGDPAAQMCLSCHDKNSGYNTKNIGDFSHPINIEPIVLKDYSATSLPLYSGELTRNKNGRIQCFSCHEVHRWDPGSTANRGGVNIEGDASNSFLRISNSSASLLCIECHQNKKQLMGSDHNLSITAPNEKNIQQFTAFVSGPCGACHIVHNAAGKRLWSKPLAGDKDVVTQLCIGCHNAEGAAKEKLIGDNYHPVDVMLERLNMDEAKKKGLSVLPLYDSDGNRQGDMKMVCLTCHEPHTWAPGKTSTISNDAYKNEEGDATNSFLRKVNFPSSELCKTCHVKESMVDGTPHDLNLTAPQATNLLGQTVKASGQCGACHLVHNTPNKLKLWARPYGSIVESESTMNALCKSCHEKGKSAENKIPLIATHPAGKLINNIRQFNREIKDYTLIFDKDGKEVNSGDISCPSCHNAHQWSLREKEGQGKKQNKINGKFLRTLSYKTVCIDCHGTDALLRYQYFHYPDKRGKAVRK